MSMEGRYLECLSPLYPSKDKFEIPGCLKVRVQGGGDSGGS